MTKINEKENIMAQEELEETTPAEPTPEPEEPTEPAESGITLPDDAPPVEQLTASDRLLGFNDDGNPVTATAEQLAAYAHATAPKPIYRNLCMNSRGDTLNCWGSGTSHGKISIDIEKFGYPVIKNTRGEITTRRFAMLVSIGEKMADNYPELAGIASMYGGTGLDRDITISYDLYPMFDCEVIYENSGEGEDVRLPVVGNRWNHVACTLPAGFTMSYFRVLTLSLNGSTDLPSEIDTAWYLKNIQIEWGDAATPYTYNPVIPYSLEEQAVPGKLFPDHNGVWKQVFRRTFQFQTSEIPANITLATGIGRVVDCSSIVNNCPTCYYYDDTGNTLMWSLSFSSSGILGIQLRNIHQSNKPLFLTIDYVKI